eukprot:15466298-Alexandrium_andersonii.AAC.1
MRQKGTFAVAATAKKPKQEAGDEEPWPAQYGRWEKIPKAWKWQYTISSSPEFTVELVEKMAASRH